MRVGDDDAYWMADSSGSLGGVLILIALITGLYFLVSEDDAKLYQTCIDGPHTTQNVILEDGTSHTACIPQEGNYVKL